MNAKFKMTLILVLTLALGMVLGALMQNYYMHSTWKNRAQKMRTADGFVGHFVKIIEPDEARRAEVERILRNAHAKFEQKLRPQFQTYKNIMDSLKIELRPALTDAQFEKLQKKIDQRFRRQAEKQREKKTQRE